MKKLLLVLVSIGMIIMTSCGGEESVNDGTYEADGMVYQCENPPSENEEIENTENYQYLLMTLVGECHYHELEFQLMVGSVVLNRLNSPDFPGDTIKDIVTAPGQYQCFSDGNAYREPTENNIKAAKWLLQFGSILPADIVYQANFPQGSAIYDEVHGTYFCYQ